MAFEQVRRVREIQKVFLKSYPKFFSQFLHPQLDGTKVSKEYGLDGSAATEKYKPECTCCGPCRLLCCTCCNYCSAQLQATNHGSQYNIEARTVKALKDILFSESKL